MIRTSFLRLRSDYYYYYYCCCCCSIIVVTNIVINCFIVSIVSEHVDSYIPCSITYYTRQQTVLSAGDRNVFAVAAVVRPHFAVLTSEQGIFCSSAVHIV